VQIPYTWGYVDINRIRRGTGKVVKVVSTGGNQKAKSGGMGRDFPFIYGTTFKKNESGRDFQPQKQKKNYGRHPVREEGKSMPEITGNEIPGVLCPS